MASIDEDRRQEVLRAIGPFAIREKGGDGGVGVRENRSVSTSGLRSLAQRSLRLTERAAGLDVHQDQAEGTAGRTGGASGKG